MTTTLHIRAMLNSVFRDVFEDDALSVIDATTALEIDAWDSITHVDLLVAVEVAFGIQFSTGEATTFSDVGSLVQLIERKLQGASRAE